MTRKRDLEIRIVGAGMSGLLMGIRLRKAGLPFRIHEKAESVGGTRRENRYPGPTCDVPSFVPVGPNSPIGNARREEAR